MEGTVTLPCCKSRSGKTLRLDKMGIPDKDVAVCFDGAGPEPGPIVGRATIRVDNDHSVADIKLRDALIPVLSETILYPVLRIVEGDDGDWYPTVVVLTVLKPSDEYVDTLSNQGIKR